MTNRLELNWSLDGFVDEQRYYCSETPIDLENLPVPKAVLAGDVRTYVDTDIEMGKTYYGRVGAVKNGVEKIGLEVRIKVETWNPKSLEFVPPIYLDDAGMLSTHWSSNTNIDYSFTSRAGLTAPILINNAINDLPVLHFAGSHGLVADLAKTKNFAKSAKIVYAFVVAKRITADATYKRLFCIIGAQSNPSYARFSLLNGSASGRQLWAALGSSSNWEYTLETDASLEYEMLLLKADFDAGALTLHKNGVAVATTALDTSLTTPTNDISSMTLGCLLSSASYIQFTNSEMACLVSNDKAISSDEVDKLFGWSAHKYGLSEKLPIDHPYKLSPP